MPSALLLNELNTHPGRIVPLSHSLQAGHHLLIVLMEDGLHLKVPLKGSIVFEPVVCRAADLALPHRSPAQVIRDEEARVLRDV